MRCLSDWQPGPSVGQAWRQPDGTVVLPNETDPGLCLSLILPGDLSMWARNGSKAVVLCRITGGNFFLVRWHLNRRQAVDELLPPIAELGVGHAEHWDDLGDNEFCQELGTGRVIPAHQADDGVGVVLGNHHTGVILEFAVIADDRIGERPSDELYPLSRNGHRRGRGCRGRGGRGCVLA